MLPTPSMTGRRATPGLPCRLQLVQEQENALCHENAARVENQPDFIELCHSDAPLTPRKPRKFDVRQKMSDDGHDCEQREPAHINCVQLLGLLVSETCEGQIRFVSHVLSPKIGSDAAPRS